MGEGGAKAGLGEGGGAGEEHLDPLNESGREKLTEVLDPEAALVLLAEDLVRCKVLAFLALCVSGGGCGLRRAEEGARARA